ncbi:sigma 54-interacting transcriptional regulator [Ideonella sp. B7]|uniref:sigma-54-dependent Fis family transcriptional regulator n=1 Tax=Ideonella benzenivorans TaxID=2831643 RepID=UPI001CECA4EB|nr:sigma 54-interacting transcriptional regulator [Ideonella benzenivorans]MCA6215167.1 sigma 54-interacting transcriptional regulator [Ideonella benzenivorans]
MKPDASPYVGFHKDLRGVRSLWERFHAGTISLDEHRPPYHALLLDEWQRCSALGVDVAMTRGRLLTPEEFRRRQEAELLLLDTSVPIVQEVSNFLVDVPGIMILAERTGTVLHITGDPAVRERAATRSGIVEGSQWNELTAGTNGVGTALAKRQPVHVLAAEHFCEGWHTWSCAATPIFDADGQTVLGIVDFTSIEADFRDQALGLTVSVANSIQARMALHRELERRLLLTAFSDATRQYPHDDLLALDPTGRPVTHTPTERCRQLAARWPSPTPEVQAQVRDTLPVNAPSTGAPIGSVVVLAKPAGYQKVFRTDPTPLHTAAPTEAGQPVTRFGDFVSCDPQTRRMLEDLQRIASADVNLLIIGETGTGKELLARHVHACSPRRQQPYLAINCGAISEHLMESTFFGYVKGAFSGADPRGRAGYFEAAQGGTLFLDEVGELPPAMQAALLRVLEDGSYQRVGACEPCRAHCRIIAATHRNLEQLIAEGRFRRDLYYRLKVAHRTIRPLRERPGDLALLIAQFTEAMRRKHGLSSVQVTPEAMAVLQRHAWPGNAREVRNTIEAAVLCSNGTLDVDCLPPELLTPTTSATAPLPSTGEGMASVRDYERQLIVGMLRQHRNISQVAQALGLSRSTLYRKFTELGIQQAEFLGTDSPTRPT